MDAEEHRALLDRFLQRLGARLRDAGARQDRGHAASHVPGGFAEPTYNLVMGPPLLAPGSLCLVGALGLAAAIVKRER